VVRSTGTSPAGRDLRTGGRAPQRHVRRTAAVSEAVKLADLWLDGVTDLPSGVTTIESWTRVEWIEKTLAVWSTLCDPLAARVVGAMSASLPEEMRAQAGPMAGVMSQVGG